MEASRRKEVHNMTLGEKIQQLRKASGISQEQLAEQLDVSRQSVSKWELDDAVPEIGKIVMLSELFSISTDELLKDSPPQSKPGQKDGGPASTTVEQIVRINQANKQINMGFKTVITGLIALVLEFVFLPVLGIMQKAQVNGQGFYTDFMKYTSYPPMPIVFTLTGAVIAAGLCLMAVGYFHKR
jgi:transcriptional regulator with XRE-family HTH domain